MVTVEAIVYWTLLTDCLIYAMLTATKGKLHSRAEHAWGKWFPLKPLFAVWYIALIVWLGAALTRAGVLPGF